MNIILHCGFCDTKSKIECITGKPFTFICKCGSKTTTVFNKMNLLLPVYDLSLVAKAATLTGSFFIPNVNSGPGKTRDPKWFTAIRQLKNAGDVYGYVDLMLWKDDGFAEDRPKTKKEIDAECLKWAKFYDVTFFFFDDVIPGTVKAGMVGDIYNFGTVPFYNTHSIEVIHEGVGYTKSKPFPSKNSAVMALGETNYQSALALAKTRKIQHIYITNKKGSTAYDTYPKYISDLHAAL